MTNLIQGKVSSYSILGRLQEPQCLNGSVSGDVTPPTPSPEISGTLPFSFTGDGSMIKKYKFSNNSNNLIGAKTANLVPDWDGWIMGKGLASTGEVQDNNPTLMITDFIEVEASTEYWFGGVDGLAYAGGWHRIDFYDENKTCLSYIDLTNMSGQYAAFTTPANTKYLRVCMGFYTRPALIKNGSTYAYVPYGYNLPIVLNNITYNAYLPEQLGNKLSYEDITSVLSFNSGVTYAYADGSSGGASSAIKVYSTTTGHYNANAKVTKGIDIYIKNAYGWTRQELNSGTYTLCLTVHNPPTTDTWEVSCWLGYGRTYPWRGCRCNTANVSNGVGTAYLTFTVDATNETQVGYALIRLEKLGEDDEYYQNVVIDVRIIEGETPTFTKGELTTSTNEVIPISELPQLVTDEGTNTIDVNTTPKPTKVSLLL